MASVEGLASKITARALVAFTETELDQYLEEHCRRGSVTVLDIEDPENLPGSFIQRLRDRVQHASSVDPSTPIDLNQVTARLLDTSPHKNKAPPPQSPSSSRQSSVETLPPIPTEVYERDHYNKLVNDGGRPLYPIELVDDVAKDPLAHWDMIRPWVYYLPDHAPSKACDIDWDVFGAQLTDWQDFRSWQACNRRKKPPFTIYFDARHAYDTFRRKFRRSSPTYNILYYTEGMKKLLTEYGFTRDFQLQDDQAQQDELTTWIEYLGYQYAMHYRFKDLITRLQPKYDNSWKALTGEKVLRSFETEEYVSDIRSAMFHDSEQWQAEVAVATAKSAVAALLESRQRDITDPRGPRSTSEARIPKLEAARSRLATAESSLKSIKRRNDLISEFSISTGDYRFAKKDLRLRALRSRWTLEQIPLVEAESEVSGGPSTSSDSVRTSKRSRGYADDESDQEPHSRSPKKQRKDAAVSGSPRNLRSRPPRFGLGSSHDGTPGDEMPLKQPKPVSQSFGKRTGGADVRLIENSRVTMRGDGGEHTAAKPVSPRRSPRFGKTGDRLPQGGSANRGPLSTVAPKPPRRSARIVAQNAKANQTPSRAAKVPRKGRAKG